MKTFAGALVVLGLASPALAGTNCPGAGAEAYIRQAESGWAESVATGDNAVPRRILADDFVGVSPFGSVYDKRSALSENGSSEFASNHLDYVHVRFHGGTAVVQGSERWTRRSGATGHFVWIDTWMCQGGAWKIVSAADVNLPDKPK